MEYVDNKPLKACTGADMEAFKDLQLLRKSDAELEKTVNLHIIKSRAALEEYFNGKMELQDLQYTLHLVNK